MFRLVFEIGNNADETFIAKSSFVDYVKAQLEKGRYAEEVGKRIKEIVSQEIKKFSSEEGLSIDIDSE